MSDTNDNTPEKKEPTLAEVQALAQKASETAMEAKTVAEAKQNVQTEVQKEADKQGLDLSDEDAKKIANALVTQLDSMGVFEEGNKEGDQNLPTPAATAPESSPQTTTAEPPTAPAPSADDTGKVDSAPKKRTFAERFMGR